jgi:hypothetical protein
MTDIFGNNEFFSCVKAGRFSSFQSFEGLFSYLRNDSLQVSIWLVLESFPMLKALRGAAGKSSS